MIDLYTAPTPNGWKASITLEEIGIPYTVHPIDLGTGDQKQDWFLEINPNGRIPAIVDRDEDDLAVFESGAIMVYLCEKTGSPLLPTAVAPRARVMSWLMFQMAGVGPMMGQANIFFRYFPEKIQPAIDRYQHESRRLFEVMDGRLQKSEWLADDYSLADIANWSWARIHGWSGVPIDGLSALERWMEAMKARPAVERGASVPEPPERPDDPELEKKLVENARSILQR